MHAPAIISDLKSDVSAWHAMIKARSV